MKKDHNLSNPASEPEHTSVDVSCSVHFTLIDAVPKEKLARWLASLPEGARVKSSGVQSGKAYFEATWTETR